MSNGTALNFTNEAGAEAVAEVVDPTTVEKVVTTTGGVKVANIPKITLCCQEIISGSPLYWHYAKILLPKTYEETKAAAVRCFRGFMIYPKDSGRQGQVREFVLKVSIRRSNGPQFVWAHIMEDEWWEVMNELIKEDPHVEVAVAYD
ncbi:hypothetical protein BYT27DRAFT_7244359 [Phlegmacium glaucopus]|nr:hypothetical protein BYT27DRAFT_7244359 [Phlegmacium glaucopus]